MVYRLYSPGLGLLVVGVGYAPSVQYTPSNVVYKLVYVVYKLWYMWYIGCTHPASGCWSSGCGMPLVYNIPPYPPIYYNIVYNIPLVMWYISWYMWYISWYMWYIGCTYPASGCWSSGWGITSYTIYPPIPLYSVQYAPYPPI